ncbi:hypothetical protein [Ktedonospora formicarum]|uniref:hypothetical protein n=1 Tax=Ktedonospora formicarum TaxID=2778364 RepID=UPI001C68C2C1|nr:hypothetical protein [Ktedonospora formicarum]
MEYGIFAKEARLDNTMLAVRGAADALRASPWFGLPTRHVQFRASALEFREQALHRGLNGMNPSSSRMSTSNFLSWPSILVNPTLSGPPTFHRLHAPRWEGCLSSLHVNLAQER